MHRFPHAFSGGQRQRIAVARALALHPKLIIADEPVSALDVSIQAQTLNLLQDLQAQFNLAYLFVSHDLSVVEHISDRVAVMYVGKMVEMADTEELYHHPKHPYTEALLSSVPNPELNSHKQRIILSGEVPNPSKPPSGCYFHPRCRYATDLCKHEEPPLQRGGPGHFAACHYADTLSLRGVHDRIADWFDRSGWCLFYRGSLPAGQTLGLRWGRKWLFANRPTGTLYYQSNLPPLREIFCRLPSSGRVEIFHDPKLGATDVVTADDATLRQIRLNMQMVFQDPNSSLNPRMTLLKIVSEPLIVNNVAHVWLVTQCRPLRKIRLPSCCVLSACCQTTKSLHMPHLASSFSSRQQQWRDHLAAVMTYMAGLTPTLLWLVALEHCEAFSKLIIAAFMR